MSCHNNSPFLDLSAMQQALPQPPVMNIATPLPLDALLALVAAQLYPHMTGGGEGAALEATDAAVELVARAGVAAMTNRVQQRMRQLTPQER